MSNPLRKLAGQTAVYGLSHIIGRVLYFLLTPVYTHLIFSEAEYGAVTELYALFGFFLIFLTHGMETAFFRFASKTGEKKRVFSTAMWSVAGLSALFFLLLFVFEQRVVSGLGYEGQSLYIRLFALILLLDVLSSLPLAKLRADERPWYFASVRLIDIGVNLGLNIFFLIFCRNAYLGGEENMLAQLYNPAIGVGYVFIANAVASAVKFLLLSPSLKALSFQFDKALYKDMLVYALPLIVVGMAGMANETLDRAIMKHLLPYSEDENLRQVGIYGAVYKLSMFMSLFVQAFRYAAEPFFFSRASNEKSPQLFAQVMTFFVLAGGLVFLVVLLFLDVFKLFIGPDFREGLNILPILLLANLLLGVVVNLSIWYKLTDKTMLGALVVGGGALVTVLLNVLLVPRIGYAGAAWATLASYSFIAVASYLLGKKYYPVPYKVGRLLTYVAGALGIYFLITYMHSFVEQQAVLTYALSVLGVALYGALVWFLDGRSLKHLLRS